MPNLHPIAEFSGVITNEEVCRTLSKGEKALAKGALDIAENALYQLKVNPCTSSPLTTHCLNLYMYALQSYPTQGESDMSFLDEAQLSAILTIIQSTSKTSCCG